MAEGIWNAMAQARGKKTRAISCGLAAFPGDPATPQAVEAARMYGADLTTHRSRQVTLYDLEAADMICCMTRQHQEALHRFAPELSQKITCLAQEDIADPFGGDLGVYRRAAKQIADAVEQRMTQEG